MTIKDTGLYGTNSIPVIGERVAYGDNGEGTSLALKNAQLSLGWSTMLDDTGVPGKKVDDEDTQAFTFGEVDKGGVQQPKWTLGLVFNSKDESDMITFGRLLYMCQTKGYKELASSTGNGFYDMIAYSKYGQREVASELTKTVSNIDVRINGVTANQTADKRFIKVTLTVTETA